MKTTIHSPKVYLDALYRSEEFQQERIKSPNTRKALGATALRYFEIKDQQSEYHNTHTLMINLIGHLETFKDSGRRLDANQDGAESLTRDDKRDCKREIIKYNHILREIIDTSQSMTTGQVIEFVAAAELMMGGLEDSEYVANATRVRMIGMQQEIVTEQAIGSIPGAEVIYGTVEEAIDDDLHGIDLSFTMDGDRYDLDVKASQFRENKKLTDIAGKQTKVLPFWTGLRSGELKGRFRADNEQVARVSARLMDVIHTRRTEKNRNIA